MGGFYAGPIAGDHTGQPVGLAIAQAKNNLAADGTGTAIPAWPFWAVFLGLRARSEGLEVFALERDE